MDHLHFIQDLLRILVIVPRDLIFSLQHGRAEFRRECLSHLHWLTDPSALDDDVLNLVLLGQLCQLRQQITTQGAADAAILQLDELLMGLRDFVVLDEGGIDVQPISEHHQ